MMIRSGAPIRWSATPDAETRKALQSGEQRLAIAVHAYEPTATASTFVVRLLAAQDDQPHEVERFSVHPNAPFKVADGVEPHRFLISLAEFRDLLQASELRVEVGFDADHGNSMQGMAEVTIEIVVINKP